MKLTVIVDIIANFLFIFGLSLAIFAYMPIIYGEVEYRLLNSHGNENVPVVKYEPDKDKLSKDIENILPYDPVNKDFAILIPKINVNAPVIANVSTIKEKEYMDALRKGVAHAVGTPLPGEDGNIFMFAHSSLNFWQLGPYATVFNLLNKLEKGDIVVLYYKGDVYEYAVTDNYVVPGWNTEPFNSDYSESILTLITCDPPGTTLNRRVVKARLLNQLTSDKSPVGGE